MKLSYKNMAALSLNAALSAAHEEKTYRGQCQAMAWIARNVRDQRHVRPTAQAAAEAAAQEEDQYAAVFAMAWPIRALLERGEPKTARLMLAQALAKAKTVTPAASQSEAVFLFFQASMHETERMWDEPFQALLDSSLPLDHWRHRRNVRDAICMVASVDFHFARDTATALTDEKLKTNVLELLANNKKQTPRPFFW
jgi:hypothetical protein